MRTISFTVIMLVSLPMQLMANTIDDAHSLLKAGRYQKAAQLYTRLLDQDTSGEAHFGLAKAQLYQGQYALAEVNALSAQLHLGDTEALLVLLSKISLRQNKLEPAKAYSLQLIAQAPDRPEAYLMLMEIATKQGDSEAEDQWSALYQSRFK